MFFREKKSEFVKIRQVGAELFHADRQTDVHTHTTKLIVTFRNFGNAPKTENVKIRIVMRRNV